MKGINFIEPLFHATIERRKRQTRRIMKPQPENPIYRLPGRSEYFYGRCAENNYSDIMLKPRYNVGDLVYLKEPYRLESRGFGVYEVYYLFCGAPKLVDTTELGIPAHKIASIIRSQKASKNGFANKLFMPEWAARHFIRITEAPRPERLQDISDEDCKREGICAIPPWTGFDGTCPANSGIKNGKAYEWLGVTYREAYAALIDRINGRGTWDSNPVVYVYDYELIENNNDREV